MIGWCPSLRSGVAVRPRTYLAFTCFITSSKVNADKWWHSSTMTCPYSATKSLTPSLSWALWMIAMSTQPVRSLFPPPTWPENSGTLLTWHATGPTVVGGEPGRGYSLFVPRLATRPQQSCRTQWVHREFPHRVGQSWRQHPFATGAIGQRTPHQLEGRRPARHEYPS